MAKRATRKIKQQFLRTIVAGNWLGEIVGIGSVHFGQEVQDGPPRQSVEFSYVILSASVKREGDDILWPATIMLIAPTFMKTAECDAGYLHEVDGIPMVNMSLNVTRPQFSDMLSAFDRGLPKDFHFTLEDGVDEVWPVRSWGMTAQTVNSC
ncbi:MAG: hypothetical protein JJ866_20265 [Roseibium sp.]|uniref:hypothetical protein n=1 Tax=Roseibium sp. TaxID=1936156 RepID=UPI001B293F2E|nr:hypothetical protein [Roseibium sp.]MBO6894289.1 hypothetical protein [Roseibium sp.]MBO6929516.1 hypothetical protein [Roseibium sp.]